MDHLTRTLSHNGEDVEIDEGIADLVEAMWALGIETLQSCESMDGWTWIHLEDVHDLGLLLSAVGGTELAERLVDPEVWAPCPARHRDQWRYHLGPVPLEDDPAGPWVFEVVVEFPPGDVPAVLAALVARAAKD